LAIFYYAGKSLKFKNQRAKIKMTTQKAKFSRRSNRSVHYLNREGRGSFITPFIPLILRGIPKVQKRGGSSWHNSLPLFVSKAKIEICVT